MSGDHDIKVVRAIATANKIFLSVSKSNNFVSIHQVNYGELCSWFIPRTNIFFLVGSYIEGNRRYFVWDT